MQNSILTVEEHARSNIKMVRPEHIHNYHELYFLISGKAKHFVNGEIINIKEGETVFVQKGLIHSTSYKSGEYSKRVIICFDDNFLGEEYKDIIRVLGEIKCVKPPEIIKLETEQIVKKICVEFKRNDDTGYIMCRNLIGEMLVTLYRNRDSAVKKTADGNEVIIQSAVRYISDNYSDNITLPFLAEKFAMSTSHFSKTFKSLTGFKFVEYITFVRIAEAEKLLKNGKISITDTATKCGFNDSNYFATVFKKIKGISPYRFNMINREQIKK